MRRRGFTLIELLVVIAIIAILAAILFPLMMRAKEQGRISACSANMHQIHSAFSMYCDTWSGFAPYSDPINFYEPRKNLQEPPNPNQIHALLLPFVSGKDEIFRCPRDMEMPAMITVNGVKEFDSTDPKYELCCYPKYGSSYQWRLGYLPNHVNSAPGDPELKTGEPISAMCVSAFAKPSRLGICRDAQPWHFYSHSHARDDWKDPNQAGNVMYLDGHIKFIHGTEFLAGIY